MKKLLVIAVVAMTALVSQSASFIWSCTGAKTVGTLYDYTGTGKVAADTVAYLFDADAVSQSDLLASVRAGNALSGYVDSATVNSSSKIAVTTTPFSYGTTGNYYDFYFAILDTANDQLLISSVVENNPAQAADTTTVAFGGAAATFSKASHGEEGYSSAGWYSVVPEPTSGLLMLLGMAGLALRRRRA